MELFANEICLEQKMTNFPNYKETALDINEEKVVKIKKCLSFEDAEHRDIFLDRLLRIFVLNCDMFQQFDSALIYADGFL